MGSAQTQWPRELDIIGSFIHWPYTKSKLHWYLAFWDAPDLSPFWSLDFLYTAFPEWWQLFILISCWFPADISRISWLIYPVTSMINIIYICREQHWTTSGSCLRVVVSTVIFFTAKKITHQICAEKIIAGCGVWSPPPFALGCRGCPVGDPMRCWSLISDVLTKKWLMSTLSRSLSQTKQVYLIYNNIIYNIIIFNYIRRLIWLKVDFDQEISVRLRSLGLFFQVHEERLEILKRMPQWVEMLERLAGTGGW